MRYTERLKGAFLISILVIHTALCSPVVRRDVIAALGAEQETYLPGPHQLSLEDADVFGGETMEGGSREKRLLKLKAIGLGAGLKAAGAGLKAVGALGAKAVGKVAIKTAAKVGTKVAKAAITLGIAKLLLSVVFGVVDGDEALLEPRSVLAKLSPGFSKKLHQLLGFKTRLFSGNVGAHGGSVGGGASVSASAEVGDTGVTAQVGVNAPVNTELPVIDPDKISLQVPDEFISGGFNVVNKAAPVVGDVIQNTAERLARLVGGLKPILRSSLGFKSVKRETQEDADDQAESSIVDPIAEEAPSQFRRNDVNNQQGYFYLN